MTDTNESRSFVAKWGGFLFSIGAIVVPALLWVMDVYPQIMLGAVIGATVRMVTDYSLALLLSGPGTTVAGQVDAQHIPIVLFLMAAQFATLGAGIWLWYNGSRLGIGITCVMIATYIFASFYRRRYLSDMNTDGTNGDSEWKYDVDDV